MWNHSWGGGRGRRPPCGRGLNLQPVVLRDHSWTIHSAEHRTRVAICKTSTLVPGDPEHSFLSLSCTSVAMFCHQLHSRSWHCSPTSLEVFECLPFCLWREHRMLHASHNHWLLTTLREAIFVPVSGWVDSVMLLYTESPHFQHQAPWG